MGIKKFITTYPIIFGILLSAFVVGVLLIVAIWLPSFGDIFSFPRQHRPFQSVLYTAFFLIVWISYFWRWRGHGVFWATTFACFAAHVLGVFLYMTYVGPILGWQWSILMGTECLLFGSIFAWVVERFGSRKRANAHSEDERLL